MKKNIQEKQLRKRKYHRRRVLAFWLVACLFISSINCGTMLTYATENETKVVKIGEDVNGELEGGTLTVKGQGATYDYSKESAPFMEYADQIHSLIIENGITYIGSCLFYGLGGLEGELTLPGSITGFGDYAFSGNRRENAPQYTFIRNEFQGAEVVQKDSAADKETKTNISEDEDTADTTEEEPENSAEITEEEPGSTIESTEEQPGNTMESTETEQKNTEDGTKEQQEGTTGDIEETQSTSEDSPDREANPKDSIKETEGTAEPSEEAPSETEALQRDITESAEEIMTIRQGAAPAVTAATIKRSIPLTIQESTASGLSDNSGIGGVEDNKQVSSESNEESGKPDTNEVKEEESNTFAGDVSEDEDPSLNNATDKNEETAEVPEITEEETKEADKNSCTVKYITEQEIGNPENLFFEGQTGIVICSGDNASFIRAAETAGYQIADSIINVTLDDRVEMESPVIGGEICLPECPKEISAPLEAGEFFSGEFEGWKKDSEENERIWKPGESLQPREEHLYLYSAWKVVKKYSYRVSARLENDTAVYILIDSSSNEAPKPPRGYVFSYQWQIADKGVSSENEEEYIVTGGTRKNGSSITGYPQTGINDGWTDIAGATELIYKREMQDTDNTKQFRCAVKAQSLMRSANGGVVLYSSAVGAAEVVNTVYVDNKNGEDLQSGTEGAPVRTLGAALKLLDRNASAENNIIVLVTDYQVGSNDNDFLNNSAGVAFTIQGKEGITLIGDKDQDNNLILNNDFIINSLKITNNWHIYGNGKNMTFGENVSTNGGNIYLYGAKQSEMPDRDGNMGQILVYSGHIARIAGYARSSGQAGLEAKDRKIEIVVGGDARVDNIVAGNASYGVIGANVQIDVIESGQVTNLIGGCQGFNNTPSPYTGKTLINISGGTVTNIFGAGSGRHVSLPTFLGQLDINVNGGKITNIYGSGSAAYIISDKIKSEVNISVSGGVVDNIFAAGQGGAEAVGKYEDSSSLNSESAKDCGSLTGNATIKISDKAIINGSIYASGSGYKNDTTSGVAAYGQKNAYLKGNVHIEIDGGTIKGNVFGGGKGFSEEAFAECARVEAGSKVEIQVNGGTINGNIYGGGENAKVESPTSIIIGDNAVIGGNVYGGGKNGQVLIATPAEDTALNENTTAEENPLSAVTAASVKVSNGSVAGNVYGGGENAPVNGSVSVTIDGGKISGNVYGGGALGLVTKKSCVNINGGMISGAVYGGAFGETGKFYVNKGSTVNMTGGWVRKNLYGGSELSNDGVDTYNSNNTSTDEGLIFVNLVGGTVDGNVFGGGYRGTVYGSTHLHIGTEAMSKCKYYSAHKNEKPNLTPQSDLTVGGSVYAGGDYGGDGTDYTAITVKGFSHVYVDGNGYDFGRNTGINGKKMDIGGGVFGSGASCDAGDIRLVTLDNYGLRNADNVDSATTLTSIQRADQVRLINSHVRLSGQSDVANPDQTTPYSLNRIGDGTYDDGKLEKLGNLKNCLALKGGSTLILDSATVEVANFKSVDTSDNAVAFTEEALNATKNIVYLTTGTIFRISHTKDNAENYGEVAGYSYMVAENTAEAYAYARMKSNDNNANDGGFVAQNAAGGNNPEELTYTNVESGGYRYWQVKGENATAVRHTVLTAKKTENAQDGFSVTTGKIELPPAEAGSSYKINKIESSSSFTLVNTARKENKWYGSGDNESEKNKIRNNPLTTFGLLMCFGSGFQTAENKVIPSNATLDDVDVTVSGDAAGSAPEIDFYLTYFNDEITKSQDLGTVTIELVRIKDGRLQERITMNVQIVTKASDLENQTVDLYATQSGTYTGRLIIPSGTSRKLSLKKVEVIKNTSDTASDFDLVKKNDVLTAHQVAVTMQPAKTQGWQAGEEFMAEAYDLKDFATDSPLVSIGTTDSRYEAPIDFTMYNVANFDTKDKDEIKLTFIDAGNADAENKDVTITLIIHWKKSVVSDIRTAPGKKYNDFENTADVNISQDSSISAAFIISSVDSENVPASDLWLELQTKDESNITLVPLPEETKLTLITDNQFYNYTVIGKEEKINLNQFKKMWEEKNFSDNTQGKTLTVIIDFCPSQGLSAGSYSLRLRNETGADSIGADFTVNNDMAKAVFMEKGETLSQSDYGITVNITPGSDTRFSDGVGAVISLADENENFPEGTVFCYGEEIVSPIEGKVYFILGSEKNYTLKMDTKASAGWKEGEHALKAEIFPIGRNSGTSNTNISGNIEFTVKAAPAYGLKVSQSENLRIAAPDTELQFTVDYSLINVAENSAYIQVNVKKKTDLGYPDDITGWSVSGNGLPVTNGTGSRNITITVPENTAEGTYRLVFKLGDKEDVYNIIVKNPS